MTFNDRMQALRDKWERLSQRERTMVGAMGVTFVIMVTLIVGFLITDGLSSMEERNSDMRQALRDLDTQRDSYLRNKAKTAQMETRLGSQPVQLQGYVEAAAKEAGVEISDSSDRPAAPAGKKFIERTVDLHLKPVTLDQLTHFMKAIETGKSLVVVTGLSVRTRDDKHQQLDVDMVVSTFERDTGKGGVKKDKS
ncbi:MAG TPA: type II secretion system protein GspM [Polyangia bacterium]|jgi:type II secretory pathway component PulM|nr:type II secretion system protein GspM [Polyangia bacterium]